jgi:hypothetical protein
MLRKATRAGFYAGNVMFSELCDAADKKLFQSIALNPQHVLHSLLPPKIEHVHNLRQRQHPFAIPRKLNTLDERNFILRMLYRDCF